MPHKPWLVYEVALTYIVVHVFGLSGALGFEPCLLKSGIWDP